MSMTLVSIIALALALDYLFGEPQKYHPLVGFGQWVDRLETRLNREMKKKINGILGWV